MTPKFELECGPYDDKRLCKLQLHFVRRKIGVLVSGGLDSALLYYLLQLIANEKYTVKPFIINRNNDGSDIFAQPVIDFINNKLNKSKQDATVIPINETNSEIQVSAGMREMVKYNTNINYIGIIETLPIHAMNAVPYVPRDTEQFVYPFKNLNKSHIVDCIYKLGLEKLFEITHSCVYKNYRCNHCNRCNERHWAFTKLGLVDPGIG